MLAEKSTRPEHMLAGKGSGRAVMRNEGEGRPRQAEGTVLFHGTAAGLDECRSTEDAARQQRLTALENANLIRCARADIRRRLSKGDLDFDTFLDEAPRCCFQVHVWKALTWLPNIGRSRAESLLTHLQDTTSLDVRLCELTQRDKYMLSALVSGRTYRRRRPALVAA